MAKDRIPTSRISRTARVTGLAAGQAARQLGTATTNLARGEEGKQKALERRHIEAAEQIVSALGTMKGAAMKLGQVMSFLDVGLVPEEYREEFQRKLGELRDAAPKVRFSDMRKVVESELGESLKDTFAEFDETPIAAASIGQVYRAKLHDGRDVAVKVQYPGVAQAVRADMQNLGMILRLMKRIAPGLDVKATAEEVRSRIGDELDYELEAQNQRSMARIYRGHPFIVVPDVVTSMTREKVIVSDFVSGLGFDAIKQLDQPTRDRVGEIVFRFYFGCMYRHHQFSGDPHPGNFLLMDDGKVAFLDFGLFKVMPKDLLEIELACQRAGHEQDGAALKQIWADTGFLKHPENFREDKLLAQFLDATWWYVLDEDIELVPEIATQVMIEMSDPRSSHFGQMRHETLPADHLFGRRVEMLTLAVLSQLRAHGNFHRVAREWIYDDAPVTELGRQETEFYARGMSARVLGGLLWRGAALERQAERGAGRGGGGPRAGDGARPRLRRGRRRDLARGARLDGDGHRHLADRARHRRAARRRGRRRPCPGSAMTSPSSQPAGRFDLVTTSFLHSKVELPRAQILRAAAGAVASRRDAADRRPRALGGAPPRRATCRRPDEVDRRARRCPRIGGSCDVRAARAPARVPRRAPKARIDTVVRFRLR